MGKIFYHKSHDIRYLQGFECRLSEPEVFAGQPEGMEQFWAIAGVICLRVLRPKLVVKKSRLTVQSIYILCTKQAISARPSDIDLRSWANNEGVH